MRFVSSVLMCSEIDHAPSKIAAVGTLRTRLAPARNDFHAPRPRDGSPSSARPTPGAATATTSANATTHLRTAAPISSGAA